MIGTRKTASPPSPARSSICVAFCRRGVTRRCLWSAGPGFRAAEAQTTQRPGEFTGRPIDAVIVGWKITEPLQIATTRPIHVQTERSTGTADRVVIVGWEEGATRDRTTPMSTFVPAAGRGLPVQPLR